MSFGAMTKDYKNGLFSGAIDVQILRLHDITAVRAAQTTTIGEFCLTVDSLPLRSISGRAHCPDVVA